VNINVKLVGSIAIEKLEAQAGIKVGCDAPIGPGVGDICVFSSDIGHHLVMARRYCYQPIMPFDAG
jgi:hypothetical protein